MSKNFWFPLPAVLWLIATFVCGLPFGIMAGVAPTFAGVLWFLARVAIKFVALLLVGRILTSFVARGLLGTSVGEMFASMHATVANQENLSPAFVISGLGLATAQIFAFAHAATWQLYCYEVLTKGAVGLLLGLFFAMYQSRRAGVVSADHFAEFYNNPENNQIVLYVMVMLNVAMLIVMQS